MKRIFRNRTFSWKTGGIYMRRNEYLCKTGGGKEQISKTAVVSKTRSFTFCFQKQAGFYLLFLLTTLKIGIVLSKSPNEAVKGPK